MTQTIFLVACVVLFLVPPWFVVNSVYQDGVIGRAGLLGISFGAAIFLAEAAFGTPIYAPPLFVWLAAFFAIFMVWHLFRFHRRVLKNGRSSDLRGAT